MRKKLRPGFAFLSMGITHVPAALLAGLILPFSLSPALAAATTLAVQDDKTEPEVIVVTAQKRVQRLQDVPLAITALTEQELVDRGINKISDLAASVPNLHAFPAPGSNVIASVGMRGFVSGQPSIWADPAVGIYVDGIYVGKNMGALTDVLDLVRVEALRGPQGTLFGRNTNAGAINFISRKPQGDWSGMARLTLGTNNAWVRQLSLDLPEWRHLRAALTLRDEQRDGNTANPTSGIAWDGRDRKAGRLALQYLPSDNFTLDIAVDRTRVDEPPPVAVLRSSRGYASFYPADSFIGGVSALFQQPSCLQPLADSCLFFSPGLGPALRAVAAESMVPPSAVSSSPELGPPYQRLAVDGLSATAEYQAAPNLTLRYLGSTRKMRYADNIDLDGSHLHLLGVARVTDYQSYSHELQWLASTKTGRYTTGLYGFADQGQSAVNQGGAIFTLHPDFFSYQASFFSTRTRAFGLFGQWEHDWRKLTFGLGGRYTHERKGVASWRFPTDAFFTQTGPNSVDVDGVASFARFTPSMQLLYRLNAEQNLYARVAQGFRSGGFPAEAPLTASSAPNQPFQPETVTAFELGSKGLLPRQLGQYNLNLFLMQMSNQQLSILPAGSLSPTVLNAGRVKTYGLEFDAKVRLSATQSATVAYGYLDGHYQQYLAVSAYGDQVNAASNTLLSSAARHSFNLTLQQGEIALTEQLALSVLADFRYLAKRYAFPAQRDALAPNAAVASLASQVQLPALSTLNLKLSVAGWRLGNHTEVELSFYIDNLTNQRRPIALIDLSGFYQLHYFNEPRTAGAQLIARW